MSTRPLHVAWPSGDRPGDPAPTPINAANLWRWALLTWRAERHEHRRLGRPVRVTPRRVLASVFPRLERPVFIVGAARSGTTFLGDSIGRIPEISYHHEPPATKAAGRYVHEGVWGFRRARWFYRLVYGWLVRTELEGGLRFAEKTPTNALLIPFLARAFPDACFIHILRDGRDAALSHLRKPWMLAGSRGSSIREPGGYLIGPFAHWWVEPDRRREFEETSDIHRMIWAWRRHVEAAVRDGRALGAGRYLEIRYEQLMSDPSREGERLLDFLGITRPGSRETFLASVARADGSGVGAWRRELSIGDLEVIEADAGRLLRELGHDRSAGGQA